MTTVLAEARVEGSLVQSLPLRAGQPVAGGLSKVAVLWRKESQAGGSSGSCSGRRSWLGKGLSMSQGRWSCPTVPLSAHGPGTGHVVGTDGMTIVGYEA